MGSTKNTAQEMLQILRNSVKWAETVPETVGNPLYHWTHLELARYFNILRSSVSLIGYSDL